jgi:hypothetical protein
VAVRGAKARSLLQRLLDALADDLPPDVTVRVTGEGLMCGLQAWRTRDGRPVRRTDIATAGAPFGIGPLGPLPRRAAARLTAVDALEMIQDVVSTACGWPWPSLGFDVHADADDGGVQAWLEDASGHTVPAGLVSLDAT